MPGLKLGGCYMQTLQEDLYIEATIHIQFQQWTITSQADCSADAKCVVTMVHNTNDKP